MKSTSIFDERGHVQLAVNIFSDITEQKELEQRKDAFIGMASHELKTPVTSLQGFTQLLKQKIFERFYQVSDTEEKPFSGLGIGFYISSQIIKQHQGRIGVESTKRAGATFYFTLPLKDPKVALLIY